MSSKRVIDEGKKQVPTLAPAAKTQKMTTIVQSNHSLLLETCPEILRRDYSFLNLKEALVLRRTHRQFHQASGDIFQYSFVIM
jgi:hypothetical protein